MLSLTRMDLDGPTSPTALVTKILKVEPGLTLPIPIEEIARQLDITDIVDIDADGFVGGLITDTSRSTGSIILQRDLIEERRRFTIGHELGHFLMVHHKGAAGGFRCTAVDMRRNQRGGELTPAMRQEVEANEFSSLLLMPPPLWRKEMARFRQPDISQVTRMAQRFGVSKEAAARTYASYHEQPIAMVVVKDGRFERAYRNVNTFPTLCVSRGMPIPQGSIFHRAKGIQVTDLVGARAEAWLESDWGKPLPELSEQVQFQAGGYALIMLWAEMQVQDEEFDPDENRTSKQRFADRAARYSR